jgi:hypothetical protein
MTAAAVSAARFAAPALDMHEGLSHPAFGGGCDRWPKALRLRDRQGRLVMGRCGATNKCEYCSRIEAVVQSEMLALDALQSGEAPGVWCVLTTRDTAAQWDAERYSKSMEQLLRAVRKRFPEAQYVCIVEFTTGYGTNSGGKRRPHWNVLWKGVGRDEIEELAAIVRRVWCRRENALPVAQHVGIVEEFGGLMRYLALHFLKESQRPPDGWSGKRVRCSKGYFGAPRWQVRRDAETALRLKRELHKAHVAGLGGEEALVVAEAEAFAGSQREWELVHLTVGDGGEVVKLSTLQNRTPVTLLGLPRSSPLSPGLWVKQVLERDSERASLDKTTVVV